MKASDHRCLPQCNVCSKHRLCKRCELLVSGRCLRRSQSKRHPTKGRYVLLCQGIFKCSTLVDLIAALSECCIALNQSHGNRRSGDLKRNQLETLMNLSCMTWFTGFEVMLSSPSSRHNLVLSHSVFGPCISLLLSRSTEKEKMMHRLTDHVHATWSCVITQRCHKQIAVKETCQSRPLAHENPLCCKQFWTQCCVWLSMHCTWLPCLVNPLCHLRISAAFPTKRIIHSKIKRSTR